MRSDAERAREALLHVYAKLEAPFDREMRAEAGISLSRYDVLRELDSAGSRLTMTELAAQLVLSRERISRVVDEMAREGLVVREANPSDGRSWFATLTDEGRHELLMASPTYQAAVWRGFGASATAVHLRQLAEALEAMLNDSVGRE